LAAIQHELELFEKEFGEQFRHLPGGRSSTPIPNQFLFLRETDSMIAQEKQTAGLT